MDKTTLRHSLSTVEIDFEWDFHVFVRSDDGNVEHFWTSDDQATIFGPEDLGGTFDSDPIAVRRSTANGPELHLIGRSGMELVDWSWRERPGRDLLLGQPTLRKLPAFSLADPEVLVTGGTTIHVFAPSLDGPMRHWVNASPDDGWSGQEVLLEHHANHDVRPCAVLREPGTIDLFAVDSDTGGLRRWFLDAQGWHSQDLAGKGLDGRPVAASYAPDRLDVFAVGGDGVCQHWGWDGSHWFGPEKNVGDAKLVPGDLQLLSTGVDQLTLLARRVDAGARPRLVSWDLVPEQRRWQGPRDFGDRAFPAVARITATAGGSDRGDELGTMSLLTRTADGSFDLQFLLRSAEHSIDGLPMWEDGDSFHLTRDDPGPAPGPFTPATTNPELVARRPEDLVVLGVSWNDGVDVDDGPPVEVVARTGAELTVTFPPQHVAEEVVRGKGDFQTAAMIGGEPVWRSASSGPSQVVVAVDEGTRVPLTVDGLLTALRLGRLVPADDLTDPRTQLELPTGLMMTPFAGDGVRVVLDHPAGAVLGPGGTVGLWSSRLAAEGTAPAEPAGLTMRALGAGGEDAFPTSLRGGSRGRIILEEPTARIDRLWLSALGGSLTAAGSWPTFEWDHHAILGRDHRVRVATQGVIYPFGHRAVHVESSERIVQDTEEGSIAHLLKTSVLIITERIKELPLSRAFPFTRVEMQRTRLEFGTDPVFTKKTFPHPAPTSAPIIDVLVLNVMTEQLRAVIPQRQPGDPLVEDYAALLVDATDAENNAADRYLVDWLGLKRNRAHLAALQAGASAEVDVFTVPGGTNGPVLFPVVLSGPSNRVHIETPVVFVADVRLTEGLLHPAYSTLEDPDVLRDVAAAFATAGGDDTAIAPVRIDMVGSADPKPPDSPEVRRLHIVGEPRDGGFAPRLGVAPAAGETTPPPERWAFELAMPEIATLVGQPIGEGPPVLRVALSPELLSGAPDPGLLFVAPEGVKALEATFSRNSARSGGLAAPDLTIDGVSRSQGPVRAETFLAQVQQADLDPAKFLGKDANVMGIALADLVDGERLAGAPQILADNRPGQPPTVTMLWADVPLSSDQRPDGAAEDPADEATPDILITSDASRLTVDVTLRPDGQDVTCTVTDITLAFPDKAEDTKLLEVHLDEVAFSQHDGTTPQLRVGGVTTKFFGFLKLLEKLQEAVKMDGGPTIHASDRGVTATFDLPVPDVAAGGFQLTGLTFRSTIDVPFDKRPVSIELGFASREDPFNVSVLALGGGGYVDMALDSTGLQRLEIALEFGASIEVDFFVASGEVHVMGGIRVVADDGFKLAGYLRFGGMVEVLGLISVSVELVATLEYVDHSDDPLVDNAMIARATLVLEVDLLLVSDSVELDTGPWIIGGDTPAMDGGGPLPPGLRRGLNPVPEPVLDPGPGRGRVGGVDPETWRSYRAVFDEGALS